VAKLAGQMVAVCERYYVRIDMAVKAKELTEYLSDPMSHDP
jgi:hypothetical protein